MKCEYCGSTDNVVDVIATHYTDDAKVLMCGACRGEGVSLATMGENIHERPKITPE